MFMRRACAARPYNPGNPGTALAIGSLHPHDELAVFHEELPVGVGLASLAQVAHPRSRRLRELSPSALLAPSLVRSCSSFFL